MCWTERWKGRYWAKGGWADDRRLQMGGVSAASVAHRLGMLLAALLLEDLDEALAAELDREEEDPASLDADLAAEREKNPAGWAGLRGWRAARRAACPGIGGSDRPYDLRNFQDDFTFQVVALLARWADGVIRASLGKWRVALSGKETDLAGTFESIGGKFTSLNLADERRMALGPRPATLQRLREAEEKLLKRSRAGQAEGAKAEAGEPRTKRTREEGRLYYRESEAAMGLLEWCGRFVDGGGLLCHQP